MDGRVTQPRSLADLRSDAPRQDEEVPRHEPLQLRDAYAACGGFPRKLSVGPTELVVVYDRSWGKTSVAVPKFGI